MLGKPHTNLEMALENYKKNVKKIFFKHMQMNQSIKDIPLI